jgi:hypothetical protein
MNEKNVFKLWAILYDRHNQEIARYPVVGAASIGDLIITWSLHHDNIESIKIITGKP